MIRGFPQAFRPVAAILGCVLVVAAVLKFLAAVPLPTSPLTDLLPGWATAWIPIVEGLLGVWLFSGYCRYGSWLIAQAFLVLFALHGFFLTIAKQSSCGCFGSVTIPPIFVLFFDVVMFALLLRCRPAWSGWPVRSPALQTAGVAAVVLLVMMGIARVWYGSVHVAVAAARGIPIASVPASLYLGRVEGGSQTQRNLRVVNLSGEEVQVLMSASSCQCAEVEGLPVTIPPGGSADLSVTVTVSRTEGDFQRVGRLRTSAGDLDFKISAFVKNSQTDAAVGRVSREEDR